MNTWIRRTVATTSLACGLCLAATGIAGASTANLAEEPRLPTSADSIDRSRLLFEPVGMGRDATRLPQPGGPSGEAESATTEGPPVVSGVPTVGGITEAVPVDGKTGRLPLVGNLKQVKDNNSEADRAVGMTADVFGSHRLGGTTSGGTPGDVVDPKKSAPDVARPGTVTLPGR